VVGGWSDPNRTAIADLLFSPLNAIYPDAISVDDRARGTGTNQFNYEWIHYSDFADYLTEVVNHFRDSWGITFTYVDPLNEPSVEWTKSGTAPRKIMSSIRWQTRVMSSRRLAWRCGLSAT
jgi:hypothetical protein